MFFGPTTISLRCWAFFTLLSFLVFSALFVAGKEILRDIRGWWKKVGWSGVASAVILVSMVSWISYHYEAIKSNFPWLISWQLKSYKWFSIGDEPVAKFVIPIEIDDATFYGYMQRKGSYDETDRRALATLVTAAADQGAKVIALDINLDPAATDEGVDQEPNRKLRAAFADAVSKGIPVILVFGFHADGWPITPVFLQGKSMASNGSWNDNPRAGFDHAPDDMRKVPLEVGDKNNNIHFPSFALRIADAFDHTVRNELAPELNRREFVYTNYLHRCQFSPVSALEYLCGQRDPNAHASCVDNYKSKYPDREPCVTPSTGALNTPSIRAANSGPTNQQPIDLRNKIVLIGGNRHTSTSEVEKFIDDHDSPIGWLRGMYFHANYVEGLLDHRVLYTVPPGLAALLDGALAVVVLLFFEHQAESMVARLGILFLLACAIAIAFTVISLCVGYVLDFVVPLVLLVLHPALEKYIKIVFTFFGAAGEWILKILRMRSAAQ